MIMFKNIHFYFNYLNYGNLNHCYDLCDRMSYLLLFIFLFFFSSSFFFTIPNRRCIFRLSLSGLKRNLIPDNK